MDKRIIAHIDMDAFFASIEERDTPWLKGEAIVVGADPLGGEGRGVVSTANYKARAYGIHSAMPISKAWRLAEEAKARGEPQTFFVGGHFDKYTESAARIMAIIGQHTPVVEQASVDEAYFDLSKQADFDKAIDICQQIKNEIKKEEQLTASIGIGPNKLVAKIASDFGKPDGFMVVREDEAEQFLAHLHIRKIPGIGPHAEQKLLQRRITTVEQARKLSWEELESMFGVRGFDIYEKIRGISDTLVVTGHDDPQSIGEQHTFAQDSIDLYLVMQSLESIALNLVSQLKNAGMEKFRTVVLTVRFEDFVTRTRSHTENDFTLSSDALAQTALKLFLPFMDSRENPGHKKIRLIGLRIEKLS